MGKRGNKAASDSLSTVANALGKRTVLVPEAIVIGLVSLALACGATVSLGIHHPWTALPLAVVVCVLLWRAVRPTPRTSSQDADSSEVPATRTLLAWVTAWTVWGAFYASEFLVVVRDPGFLTLSGWWLVKHPSTDIPTDGTIAAAAVQRNMLADAWQAWNLRGDVIQPQGAKMLPAVLSVGGWIGGLDGLLMTNVLIGAVGVLLVYLLARKLLGPWPAVIVAMMFSLNVAHLALSRSAYSEPLTLVLILAGVLWAWRGVEERRLLPLVAGGLASGATALVRIDGAAYALGVLCGVAVAAVLRGRWGSKAALAFALPQLVMIAAGYASLWRWSTAYVERLGSETKQLTIAYAVAVAVLIAAALLWSSMADAWWPRLRAHRWSIASAASWTTAAVGIALAARPLVMKDRRGTTNSDDIFTNKVVAAFQQTEGFAVDQTRTYAEHTVTWLSYYFTWPVLALALVGLVVLAHRAFSTRPGLLPLCGAIAVPSAIYLIRPAVVPDQIWAIRRFEPATVPVLAIAAGVGAWWLLAWATDRVPHRTGMLRIVAGVVLIGAPLTTYISVRPHDGRLVEPVPYVAMKEQGGAKAGLDTVCEALAGRPVVLVGASDHFGSIRVMCDVPVVLALVAPTADALAQMRGILGDDLVVLTQQPEKIWDETPGVSFTTSYDSGEYALQHLPRHYNTKTLTWYLGQVQSDGSVTPSAAAVADVSSSAG